MGDAVTACCMPRTVRGALVRHHGCEDEVHLGTVRETLVCWEVDGGTLQHAHKHLADQQRDCQQGSTHTSVSLIQFILCEHHFKVLDEAGVELHSKDELRGGAVLLLVEALDLQTSCKGQ